MTLRAFSWTAPGIAILLAISGQPVRAQQTTGAPPPAECEMSLQAIDQSWKGLCGPVFANKDATTLSARKVASLPTGSGRGDAAPTLMLVAELGGRVAELGGQSGTSQLELEFYGKDGVIRTEIGWRQVNIINASATTLRFRVAENVEPEPTDFDRRIVERAAAILASEAVWDRADDRKCAPEDKSWSMYCAIHRASLEVTGGFHHRRPCLQVVRAILWERVADERKRGRKYPHIMADYNNDPAIRLADVHSLLTDAVARMKR